MNKSLKLRLEAIKLNCELAQDIMNAQSDKLKQIEELSDYVLANIKNNIAIIRGNTIPRSIESMVEEIWGLSK